MKISIPAPSLWPRHKSEVMKVAQEWYQPDRVSINHQALAELKLPPISIGADTGMIEGAHLEWPEHVEMIVALNSINYRFWDKVDGEFTRYSYDGQVGAMGMRAAFQAAWEDPKSPLNRVRQGGKLLDVADILEVFGDMPAPQSRADILNEVLGSGKSAWAAQMLVVGASEGLLDVAFAADLADVFPLAYGDEVLKKSQLALSEVWVAAKSRKMDVNCDLTAFADYQIPNVLRAIGVLSYAPDLTQSIANQELLAENGADERAIRGASLLAVEQLATQLNMPVAAVDHYLWTRRKEATDHFHLTDTTAY